MTMKDQPSTFDQFYTSVLTEIEFGKVDQGINLLVGMLDALTLQGYGLVQAIDELSQHSLHTMLLEDPTYQLALCPRRSRAMLLDIVSQLPDPSKISSTGQRLLGATRNLPIGRSLRQCRDIIERKLERAWLGKSRVCLFGATDGEYAALFASSDQSQHTCIVKTLEALNRQLADAYEPFDLLIAPNLADTCDLATLSSNLALLLPHISQHGTVVICALTPQHLGSGWRTACLNWEPYAHSEQGLRSTALEAGFDVQTYHDESNCMVWAELRPVKFGYGGETKCDGY